MTDIDTTETRCADCGWVCDSSELHDTEFGMLCDECFEVACEADATLWFDYV